MATSYYNRIGRIPGSLPPSQARAARWLFYSGWGITLLYFPSGLMHAIFGSSVYFRDILLLIHLSAASMWLIKTGKFADVAKRSWLLAVPAIFVVPALFNDTFRVEALTFIKWTAFWLDWICMGRIALVVVQRWQTGVVFMAGLTALLLLSDLGAGFYEKITNAYIFHVNGEVSAFGVEMGKETTLASHLRVKGLQRDVFSFANLMAASCVAGLLAFVNTQELRNQVICVIWSSLFGYGMFTSGGRSAFFGVFASALIAGGLLFMPEAARKYYSRVVLGWFLIAITISFTGVGQLSESIGGSVMSGSHIGNSDSAYMRDANWAGITQRMKDVPVVLVSGGPLASLLDPKIDAIYHWADNQYLWLLYHTGFIGFLAVVLYFWFILGARPPEGKIWIRDALVLYLLFVMGEAIARESLTFIGCMPLFVACGCHGDIGGFDSDGAPRSSSRRSREAPKVRTDGAADFARRIREAERRKG